MVKRVNLDAMIPREDFGIEEDEYNLDLLRDFPIANLASDSPIFRLLRKPDFQRETNHWTPEQIATFVASFLDNEVIPGLILWKSPQYVFVIDGGHRLSALRAWMQDDYGDGAISQGFYGIGISHDQKKVATRTRTLIEASIGRFSTLKSLVDNNGSVTEQSRRARRLFTRALSLQWVQGTAPVAETSFFKINSQGTPLDETEQMLIRHRRTAIAISARAILRSGTGHKYWSAFATEVKTEIEALSGKLFKLLFQPEVDAPLKSIDVPLGGSVSPVNALSLLIDFLLNCAVRTDSKVRPIYDYKNDDTGIETISVLKRSLAVAGRITGNGPESLGLHPAVYFYNERGKHSQFMFLGITYLFAEIIRNNNDKFWKDFTKARSGMESFLIENKSLIGIILQNLSKGQRVSKMRDLFVFLIEQTNLGKEVTPEEAIQHLGLRGRIFDINAISTSSSISDDTKSAIFVRNALANSMKCKECEGLLDATKSISYDHIKRVRDGGTGDVDNVQLLHPFCNTGMKN